MHIYLLYENKFIKYLFIYYTSYSSCAMIKKF